MNPFTSLRDYEEFVYTVQHTFPSVKSSTLVVVPRGRRTAVLRGQLIFESGYRLTAQERLSSDSDTVVIESYGYEIWHNSDKNAWYDSQPHPHVPELAVSQPHHKHIPPNIKSNRIPAPQLSFTRPNLPVLIQEIEAFVRSEKPA
ncbi:MAG: hypothetical protein B6I30_10240 [Desulfobacteraceae bacterium 4572_187]|nr:MAG: hypothetical protein B6I30_10240 [Desulfobacteraceae bacterium 4572_187]